MREMWTLAGKDLRLLLRDRTGAMLTFGVPILFALFFGHIFSHPRDDVALDIVLVDEDGSSVAADFGRRLDAAPELVVSRDDREGASERVRRGDAAAYVLIPEGFAAQVPRLLLGESVSIELGVDPALQVEEGMLEGLVTRAFVAAFGERLSAPGEIRETVRSARLALEARRRLTGISDEPLARLLSELDRFLASRVQGPAADDDPRGEAGGWAPLVIEGASIRPEHRQPANPFEISFPQGLVWGLIACAATFATTLVAERTGGTLMRLRTAPLTRLHILAGKALACFATGGLVMIVLFSLGAGFFGVRPDSVALLVLGCLAVDLAFVGIMMAIALLGRTERSTSSMGWAVFVVLAMIGGGMVPLAFMPDWMQAMSVVSPVRWAIVALEGPLWRGFDLGEMLPSVGVLVALGLGGLLVGVPLFRFANDGG